MFSDSAGWHFSIEGNQVHTIMAYADFQGEPAYNAFSNPRRNQGETGVADHARTIQRTMQIMANLK
jgi:hypothetical protein